MKVLFILNTPPRNIQCCEVFTPRLAPQLTQLTPSHTLGFEVCPLGKRASRDQNIE
jgi:hypothetical protein